MNTNTLHKLIFVLLAATGLMLGLQADAAGAPKEQASETADPIATAPHSAATANAGHHSSGHAAATPVEIIPAGLYEKHNQELAEIQASSLEDLGL
ncbi:MAG: hypothetical protein AAGI44_16715, partial [Pseudomonadota bacterium]